MRLIIVLLAALTATSMLYLPVRADGLESYKDDPRPRRGVYGYAYTVRQSRASWSCPPELSRRECRRIMAEVEQRRARRGRRDVYSTPRALRNVDPGPVRSASRRGRCAPYVKVNGPARWTNALAIGAARKEWRREVRTVHGERYIDERYSPDFRISRPRIVGDRGIAVRATAQGTPCAGDQ